jgi:hypothetical protein
MLAFTMIGLSSVIGADRALAYWEAGNWFNGLDTILGIAHLVGWISYTAGSLTECVFWFFALFESEWTGFNTGMT